MQFIKSSKFNKLTEKAINLHNFRADPDFTTFHFDVSFFKLNIITKFEMGLGPLKDHGNITLDVCKYCRGQKQPP